MCRWVLNRTATGDRRRPCFINKGAKEEIQLPQQGQWMPSVVPQDIMSDLPPLLQKCVHAPWIPCYTCQPLWVAEIPGISNGTGYQCICSPVLHFMQQIRGTGSDPLVFSRQCFRAEFWKLIPIKQRTKHPSCGKSFQAVLDEVQSVQLPHSREFASHSPELSHSAFYLEFSKLSGYYNHHRSLLCRAEAVSFTFRTLIHLQEGESPHVVPAIQQGPAALSSPHQGTS